MQKRRREAKAKKLQKQQAVKKGAVPHHKQHTYARTLTHTPTHTLISLLLFVFTYVARIQSEKQR